ncbi:MAG: hypothetical protein V3T64_04500, partial [Myxococcota bacterium]
MDLDRDLLSLDPAMRFAAMRQLRANSPVHRLGGDAGPWYIARRAGVCQALPRIEHFGGGVGAADVDPDHQALNGVPEPRHGRIRKMVQGLIGPHRIGGVKAFLAPLCSAKLDEIAKRGEPVDVMTEYLDHVPSSAIAWLLGWDIADAIQLFQWTVEICERAMSMKPGNTGTLTEIHPVFAAYIDERIGARLAVPKDAWPDDGLSR